ncbi:Uncharacterised protein [Bordetella pertussis]|nr:Uncharacterised protein [Bordetella pertussis]CFO93860.1 Uncharacterised protein [Bordetella pertussis]CPO38609.1 Uncharacterised protein [Bordetella pertussis]CRE09367.1 Uncharacterised protein [Bordetella pertussis]
MAACQPMPARWRSPAPNTAPSNAPQTTICKVPAPNTSRRIAHSRLGASSRPITNSIITTPHSETRMMSGTSVTSPSPDGPITPPASR